MIRLKAGRYALAALAVAGLAAGCTADETPPQPGDDRVASLQSAGPRPAPSGDPADRRPLIRLDASSEERDAAWDVWMQCVRQEGGPEFKEQPKLAFASTPAAAAVRKACLAKEPETYEERLKRTDISAFRDNQRQWYECAEREGYAVGPPDEDGRFGITSIGPNGDFASPKMEACRIEAFRD